MSIEHRLMLDGRVALVTGGASGISLAMASALGQAGSRIWIADLDEEMGQKAMVSLKSKGIKANFSLLDVTNRSQVERLVSEIVQREGRLDILFNGAGINNNKKVIEMSEEEWDNVVYVNLKGVFLCCRTVLPQMLKQGYGRIINVTSGQADGAGGHSVYGSTKAAIISFSRSLAAEIRAEELRAEISGAKCDVTVNVIAPGPTDTPMYRKYSHTPKHTEHLKSHGGLGAPPDMGPLVVFLSSPESSMISGNVISSKIYLAKIMPTE